MSRLRFHTILACCCSTLLAFPLLTLANEPLRQSEIQIKAENGRWAEAYAQGDYEAIGKLYTNDGMLLPPGENRVVGQAAITSYFMKKSHPKKPYTVSFSNNEFYGDNNTMTEISDTEIRDHEGRLISCGKQTLVFLKQGGSWKLHRDMWNSNALRKPDNH